MLDSRPNVNLGRLCQSEIVRMSMYVCSMYYVVLFSVNQWNVIRSRKTGNMLPWSWTDFSCGSSRLPASSEQELLYSTLHPYTTQQNP